MPQLLTVSCFSKIQIGLPFWYWPTWVVQEKGPLNGCVCVYSNILVCGLDEFWRIWHVFWNTVTRRIVNFWCMSVYFWHRLLACVFTAKVRSRIHSTFIADLITWLHSIGWWQLGLVAVAFCTPMILLLYHSWILSWHGPKHWLANLTTYPNYYTTTIYRPLFQDNVGKPVPER